MTAFRTLFALLALTSLIQADQTLTIKKATYGDHKEKQTVDVTSKVSAQVKEGKVRLVVWNDLFGEPAEGVRKSLQLEYELDGKPGKLEVYEGDTLLIPQPKLEGKLAIVSAHYGIIPDYTYDVTTDVKRYLEDNKLSVEVSNDLFGDPASGEFKWLKVVYRIGDVELIKQAWEGQTLNINTDEKQE
ncbi:MAG: hypothetical protein KDA69_01765 [Planctomycetaceae bacterium]|nr:hypothetical protein [Planctomycetaceae bacterium]MCA9043014.1 hypothetical protein [Planctomycetaceae bacterium]MCB9950403.1 hypothetical protein [Planctomycetaceae bacterium]